MRPINIMLRMSMILHDRCHFIFFPSVYIPAPSIRLSRVPEVGEYVFLGITARLACNGRNNVPVVYITQWQRQIIPEHARLRAARSGNVLGWMGKGGMKYEALSKAPKESNIYYWRTFQNKHHSCFFPFFFKVHCLVSLRTRYLDMNRMARLLQCGWRNIISSGHIFQEMYYFNVVDILINNDTKTMR